MRKLPQLLPRLSGLRATVRSLCAKPSYVVISVIVLGISIAALMDISAIVDATLVRPPSGRSPQELAFVRSSEGGMVSFPDFIDIRERNTFFLGHFRLCQCFECWPVPRNDKLRRRLLQHRQWELFPHPGRGNQPTAGCCTDKDDVEGSRSRSR